MSRRTIPVYSGSWSCESATSFLPSHRHYYAGLHNLYGIHHLNRTSATKDASTLLFEGLDEGRFDQVRRAVAVDRKCLQSTSRHRSLSAEKLEPVAYALENCRMWSALAEHCRRTGTGVAQVGDLTFYERLSAMNIILKWMLTFPEVSIPDEYPLHTALACRLDDFAHDLLARAPSLARLPDARGKTPMHVVCALPSATPPALAARHVRGLVRLGADAAAADYDGSTPLHEVVRAVRQPVAPYGLIRRRGVQLSLERVVPIIDVLLVHGASLSAIDGMGSTALEIALLSGLDYVIIVQRAALLRERLCGLDIVQRWRPRLRPVSGIWGTLPDDVIVKIMSLLSPYDVAAGLGATCCGLRAVSTSEFLWTYLETSHCLNIVRRSIMRNSLKISSSSPT